MTRRGLAGLFLSGAALTACGADADPPPRSARTKPKTDREPIPQRFTIAPDDYHVPYAGTAEDGRKFFLSRELTDFERSYVGLYLWDADGNFDSVDVTPVGRPKGVPPGQAMPAGADSLVRDKLATLGDYTLEPVEVAPFMTRIDGTKFGWHAGHYKDGTAYINIEPGDFICYYAPWDGLGYDT